MGLLYFYLNYSNGVLFVLERWLLLNEDIQVAKKKMP
jgi:hypothetical protein